MGSKDSSHLLCLLSVAIIVVTFHFLTCLKSVIEEAIMLVVPFKCVILCSLLCGLSGTVVLASLAVSTDIYIILKKKEREKVVHCNEAYLLFLKIKHCGLN